MNISGNILDRDYLKVGPPRILVTKNPELNKQDLSVLKTKNIETTIWPTISIRSGNKN